MISHQAAFSLRGTNINLPNHYKIRKFRAGKAKSQKQENNPQNDDLRHCLQVKQTIPVRTAVENPAHKLLNTCSNTTSSPQQSSPCSIPSKGSACKVTIKLKSAEEVLSVSNPKFTRDTKEFTSIRKRNREHYSSMKQKRCTCGDCEECMKDFAYFLQLISDDQSVPEITAKSWVVWKKKNGKYMHHYGKRIHKVRQIASLTKMVTAITAYDFLSRFNWNPGLIKYEIRKTSTLIGGTSAKLVQGQICTLLELFYGMMLPSGNDAAIAVSEAVGLIAFLKGRGKQVNPENQQWYEPYKEKNYAFIFIGMMNQRVHKMGTLDTKFFNSHGNDAYDQVKNISTCNQIAKIASQYMSIPLLKQISSTAHYGSYENTNKLLEDGFDGIKTGITDTAGPCLAAAYKDYIIVVLHSKSMNQRWIQVKKLVKWIVKKP